MLHTKENLHTYTDISLDKHKLWSIEGDRRGDMINCVTGNLWITQEADLKDYVLEAGKSFWVTKPGTVVIQALEKSQFKYSLNELQSHLEHNQQPVRSSRLSRVTHHLR